MLHDNNALTLARMLVWLQYDDYPLRANILTPKRGIAGAFWSLIGGEEQHATPPVVTTQDELDVHIDVWAVADKYDVEQLKAFCIKKMRAVMLDELHNNDPVWHVAKRLAKTEWDTTELDAFVRNWLLFHLSHYADDQRLEKYVKDNPALGYEVVKKMRRVAGSRNRREYRVEVEDEYA